MSGDVLELDNLDPHGYCYHLGYDNGHRYAEMPLRRKRASTKTHVVGKLSMGEKGESKRIAIFKSSTVPTVL